MDNAEMVRIMVEQTTIIERLTERIDILEQHVRDYEYEKRAPNIMSSTYYLEDSLRNGPHNYDLPLENESYDLHTYEVGGWQIGTMRPDDLMKFINEVTKLRKQMSNLGDLEILKENIYKMAAETDQMQADMIRIINEEGNKAVNKIKDLASRTDTTTIDNKDLILDKDN